LTNSFARFGIDQAEQPQRIQSLPDKETMYGSVSQAKRQDGHSDSLQGKMKHMIS
jgi:hypothetical protein